MPSCTWDGGHGIDTPGKRSPDGVLREWAWTRDTGEIFAQTLNAHGVTCTNIVPEENDISLDERCRRINRITKERPDNIHVSFHINAAGNGTKWLTARGFQVHVYINSSANSRRLACFTVEEAKGKGFKVRQESPGMPFRPKNLAILRETNCPAILIECFFMDNKEDYEYLLSPNSIYECADVAARAVLKYFNKG